MALEQQESLKLEKTKPGMSRRALDYSLRISGCVGVGVLGAMIDGPAIIGINFIKSPLYFWKGWRVTLAARQDLGPALTSSIMFVWPLRVMYSMGSSVVYSLGKGLKAGVVAYQENSFQCGFKHIVAAISEYDEHTNNVVLLRDGSCLPRPAYKKKKKIAAGGTEGEDKDVLLVKATGVQEMKLERLTEFMRSATGRRVVGRRLIEEGFITLDTSIKLTVESVGLVVLGFLLNKSDGEMVAREAVVLDPLETLESQIKDFRMNNVEEECLTSLVLAKDVDATNEKLLAMEELRKATVQAFGRRIRGVSRFISGKKTFKKSYVEYVNSVLFD